MSVVVTLRGSEAWQPAGQVLDPAPGRARAGGPLRAGPPARPARGTQSQSGTAIGSVRSAEANSASTATALVA